jgi:hypothetical protein
VTGQGGHVTATGGKPCLSSPGKPILPWGKPICNKNFLHKMYKSQKPLNHKAFFGIKKFFQGER